MINNFNAKYKNFYLRLNLNILFAFTKIYKFVIVVFISHLSNKDYKNINSKVNKLIIINI